jgi:hypothetical protein
MLDTGRHLHMGFKPHRPRSKLESVNEFVERMAQGLEEAKSAIAKVKDEYTMYYNCRREPAPVFKPGDKVWLDGSDITTNRPSSKLSHRSLLLKYASAEAHIILLSLPTSAAFTPCSPWSNCLLRIQIPCLADVLHHPHPKLLSTVRTSMRSRPYWTAGCATTA